MSHKFPYHQSLYENTQLFFLFSAALFTCGLQHEETAECNGTSYKFYSQYKSLTDAEISLLQSSLSIIQL